jgi:D-amino peptidase
MQKIIFIISVMIIAFSLVCANSSEADLKVFISGDMEGIVGVAAGIVCSLRGPDYDYFRKFMTQETNAAIEGALELGRRVQLK